LPDFTWHNIPTGGKNIPKNSKIIPNDHKIDQMIIKYTKIFPFLGVSKMYKNWDFWFENIPSGNPATGLEIM
jgi:hypothetical protein